MTAIFVDGDACPVKAEVERVAARHALAVTIVSNGGLRPSANPLLRHVTVAEGADAADDWIVEHIGANDIAITADIPLAARCLDKGARVLGPNGIAFTKKKNNTTKKKQKHKEELCGLCRRFPFLGVITLSLYFGTKGGKFLPSFPTT